VVAVAGNHDNPRRLQAVAPLLDLGRVVMASALARPEEGGLVGVPGVPLRVAVVPWQSQRGIVSADDLMGKDAFEHNQDYATRMGRILGALCGPMGPDTVNLLAGHMMVNGAEPAGSERAVQTVFEYSIPTSLIPGSLSYVALGHLHRRQRVPAAAPVWYSGSLLQLDFGEAGDEKGALLIEVEPGLPATVEEVPVTGGRKLVRLSGTLEQVVEGAAGFDECFVRVELTERSRVGLADAVRDAIPGVVDITLRSPDERQAETPPVRLGRPPAELFEEYLTANRRFDRRLVGLFGDLLEEVDEA
jgi:DNA repair protein SbcD/Mre11